MIFAHFLITDLCSLCSVQVQCPSNNFKSRQNADRFEEGWTKSCLQGEDFLRTIEAF